ncbi:single-stranded DNA-binding protein [Oceanobacillus profundus]|uniref:Single-stranded DNA-binding protein n=1 Tax=Oceanobacillus profundus TaxID=372463 RepID=A0A417YHG2_9BACI|nr:single-stranded DNA-binding protein [Oceanobacillus profundus]MCM3398087.1 single-stranded DNA-binding protein [Oceanobacillus profundus]MDO6448001.1 single-stranded DNA-binding protein [Oceanobacillus profundus]PAE27286.1 single-stranded DNA-binding protein [Paenibacillus sp. 7884-2]RHW32253.1 single-stranded DNA-binding protein [Oceanobacillus profundus]
MLNRVVLVGRLTRDPDLRYTPNGVAVANFTIAVNRPFSNQQGNREADFINCVVWRRPAENLANFMKKGSMIGVDGRVQTRSFEGQDGKTVYVTEIVADSVQFLESKGSSSGGQDSQGYQQNRNQNQFQNQNQYQPNQNQNQFQPNNNQPQDDPFKNNGEPIDISDDDLPF